MTITECFNQRAGLSHDCTQAAYTIEILHPDDKAKGREPIHLNLCTRCCAEWRQNVFESYISYKTLREISPIDPSDFF